MEPEQRGRASRASSTSSLGREVRCGCQYYQSDSLLPERRALLIRPSSRTMQQPPAVRCSEHEYEPIAPPSSLPHPVMAPVVRISDTDVMPVADSDDSIDDRGRLPPELILGGDVVLPLDGKIEDNAMEARELGETVGDTSEEQEPVARQLNDRLNEQFLDDPTPHIESRTDGEVNTSQVDSSAMEELPLRHGAHGLPQRIKTQARKLRKRLRNLQRPTFSLPERQKPDKTKSTNGGKSDKSRTEKRPSRIDRIRTSISEKTKFTLPDRPKFNLPDKSKFHLPERPKFNFPDKSRFHLPDRPKFTIKKPNIHLPKALTRTKPPSLHEQQQQYSIESTTGSKRNIFDFSTYPRIFDRKSKKSSEYATSSPKDSRAESAENTTFPRVQKRKPLGARWTQRFGDSTDVEKDHPETRAMIEDFRLWHHPSLEESRLSSKAEEEMIASGRAIPWEESRKREPYDEEEIQYMDYEQESSEMSSDRHPHPNSQKILQRQEYERDEAMEMDPRLYGDQKAKRVREDKTAENDAEAKDWHIDQIQAEEKFKSIPRSRSLDGEEMARVVEQSEYERAFFDPRRFGPHKMASDEEEAEEEEEELEEGEEEHEPSSAQSDREQQHSSGSSCDRRRRGVIEEIDSDEFFLRERGISQDDMNLERYLASEIRDAFRSKDVGSNEEVALTPPQRPMRTRSLRKRKENSLESNEMAPPARPKRERTTARRSREASLVDDVFRERTRSDSRSDSRHRVVYQAEGDQQDTSVHEPLDDIVVVKPARRKSKSSLRSQSQPPMETSILSPSALTEASSAIIMSDTVPISFSSVQPVVPIRRKRSHRQTTIDQRNGDAAPICNGHREWKTGAILRQSVTPRSSRSRQSLIEQLAEDDIVLSTSQENIEKLETQLRQENFVKPIPVPPKRRSRSRATSVAADEDRTSHGAESLPEAGYFEDDIPPDESISIHDLSGYAIVEKREKPPKPLPPRRKRKDKYYTTPRPTVPKRPQRAYSTLGPAKSKDTRISGTVMSETTIISMTLEPAESIPYIEIDSDDGEQRDLRSDKMLDKIQGRPLPAPPRPPRIRKEQTIIERPRTPFEFTMETTAATQTDPLPDDLVIEEEITQAKLVVTPSRSGSQVMVSMERIPSPTRMGTPPVPPLPMSQFLQKEEKEDSRMAYDTVSLTSPSPTGKIDVENKHLSSPNLEKHVADEESQPRSLRSALLSDEPLRISSLEVGDLKVDRLSVSQIEAHKIVASEVDAMVITASELRNIGAGSVEESLSPAIIKELIAIRSHLETVATSQMQERHREDEQEFASRKIIDIPTTDDTHVREQAQSREHLQEVVPSETVIKELASVEDENIETSEDQKVVKIDLVNVKDKEMPHTLSIAQIKPKDIESPLSQTLAINQLDSKGKDDSTNHLLTVAQDIQDKSLRILDSEHPIILSSQTTSGSQMGESRTSFLSSDMPSTESAEPRISPGHVNESSGSSVQATESTTTSMGLHGSKDDVPINTEQIPRKSRSRSPSPSKGITRQTASPVRSLPPVISVTPDVTPDMTPGHGISVDAQPQRAVISYSSDTQDNIPKDLQLQCASSHSSDMGQSLKETQRDSSQSPVPSFSVSSSHFIAFPASEIPAQFFSLSEPTNQQRIELEPGIIDTTQQLLRALRLAGIKAMRHFVRYLTSTLSRDDTREKIREVELAICALLLLIAGLLIYYFSSTQTVTHYHHWDYFNPPQ